MHHYSIDLLGVELDAGAALEHDPSELAQRVRVAVLPRFAAEGFVGAPKLLGTVHANAYELGLSREYGPISGLGFWRNPSDDDGKVYGGGIATLGPSLAAERRALAKLAERTPPPVGRWSVRVDLSAPDAFTFEEGIRRRAAYLVAHEATIALGTWPLFWEHVAVIARSSSESAADSAARAPFQFSFALNAAWTLFALDRAQADGHPIAAPFTDVPLQQLDVKARRLQELAHELAPRGASTAAFASEKLLRELALDVERGTYFVGHQKSFATSCAVGFYATATDPPSPNEERNTLAPE